AACFDRATPAPMQPAVVERCFELLAGAHGLTERAATFRRTDVIEALASAAGASVTASQVEQLADQFLTSGRVLLVDRIGPVQTSVESTETEPWSARSTVPRSATQKLYTVPELVDLEADLLAWAKSTERTTTALGADA